jgi:hypothetical protein
MSNQSLADLLDLVEQRLNEVSVVLADGHPPALQQACEALQQLAIQLMQLLDRRDFAHQRTPAVGLRIKNFATAIADLRAHLIRRAVVVEQALAVVVPTEARATYGKASSPYGAVARQSGAFKVLAA